MESNGQRTAPSGNKICFQKPRKGRTKQLTKEWFSNLDTNKRNYIMNVCNFINEWIRNEAKILDIRKNKKLSKWRRLRKLKGIRPTTDFEKLDWRVSKNRNE